MLPAIRFGKGKDKHLVYLALYVLVIRFALEYVPKLFIACGIRFGLVGHPTKPQ